MDSAAGSPRWTAAARLQAVIVTAVMDEATRSAWCREQGLFPAELDAWKRDAIAGLGEPRAASAVEARQDRRRVKELERGVHRTSIGRSSHSRASPIWIPPGNGRCASCIGTTTNTATAASATSPRRSVMPGRMAPCSPPATRSIRTHGNATRNAGVGRPATGHRLASSPSIRSATSSSGRQPHKSSFPVRSASLLSRPDLAAPKPRSATQEMGGAEPPGATRSAPCRARAWRGWRAPDLLRSEHRGTLVTSRRFASPDIYAASTAASSIGGIIT